ncbi:MAG: hypothetical protein JNL58_16395 [Planctomyces sp.]|nr:hypothetical protein [Planctomyces sp.]
MKYSAPEMDVEMRGTSIVGVGIFGLLILLLWIFVFPVGREPESSSLTQGLESQGTESQTAGSADKQAAGEPVGERLRIGGAAVRIDFDGGTPSQAQPPKINGESEPAGRPPELAFKTWPVPKLALVVSGEQLGYFEPCGCTANQLGGMNRRADLVRQMKELSWPVRGIDLGSLSRRSVRQGQVKFETTLSAMRDLGYVAMGIGPEELRLDPGFLISQHVTDGESPLKFLSANLTFYNDPSLGTPLPFSVIDVDGVKVGITCVMGERQKQSVIPQRTPDEESSADVRWSDPVAALKTVMPEFEKQGVAFRILLSQGSMEESIALAKEFPAFDIVVTALGPGDGMPTAEMVGNVRLLKVGAQGKHVGVVGLYPGDTTTPIRYELVSLKGSLFGEDQKMIEHLQTYQTRLFDEQIILAESPSTHPSGASFVGAEKCGECHTKAFAVWKESAHSHALESLDPANQRTGFERLHGVPRMFDPECLSCHVTGWDPQEYIRFRTGFINEELAENDQEKMLQKLLGGNQCENCHGPGSRHVELIEADNVEAAAREVRVTLEQTKEKNLCQKCHDLDNSPEFDFDKYWEQIRHPDRD